MADTNLTTIAAGAYIKPAHVSRILGDFCARILPALPEDIPDGDFDEVIEAAVQKETARHHTYPCSPAEAYVHWAALDAAVRCRALDERASSIAVQLMEYMADAIAGEPLSLRRTKADTLARLDWAIREVEEHASGYVVEAAITCLQRARWGAARLIPDGMVVDDRSNLVRESHGPTYGEVQGAEKAFAAIGKTKEEAHAALGI